MTFCQTWLPTAPSQSKKSFSQWTSCFKNHLIWTGFGLFSLELKIAFLWLDSFFVQLLKTWPSWFSNEILCISEPIRSAECIFLSFKYSTFFRIWQKRGFGLAGRNRVIAFSRNESARRINMTKMWGASLTNFSTNGRETVRERGAGTIC